MIKTTETQHLLHERWRQEVAVVGVTDLAGVQKHKPFIIAAKGLEPAVIMKLAAQQKVTNIVQESETFARSLNTAALMKHEPLTFMEYPVSSIFDPVHAGERRERDLGGLSIEFRSAIERNAIRMQISSYLASVSAPDNVRENIFLIADELISNVIFNAPYQLFGDDTNPGIAFVTPRDTLPSGIVARIFLCAQGTDLLIGCEDPFGSMHTDRVLARLDRCYLHGVEKNIRWNGRGAGIGLYLVCERSTSTFIAVNPMFKTLVCAQVSLLKSERARNAVPKSLHWIEIDP